MGKSHRCPLHFPGQAVGILQQTANAGRYSKKRIGESKITGVCSQTERHQSKLNPLQSEQRLATDQLSGAQSTPETQSNERHQPPCHSCQSQQKPGSSSSSSMPLNQPADYNLTKISRIKTLPFLFLAVWNVQDDAESCGPLLGALARLAAALKPACANEAAQEVKRKVNPADLHPNPRRNSAAHAAKLAPSSGLALNFAPRR
ncbi:hypothetical protein AOLI_G00244980 [Acnodon oligacanthus]